MTPKDVKHIVYLDIFIIAFTIICLAFSLIVILSDNVSARTIEADITNSLSIPTTYSGCTQSNGYFWGDDGNSGTACKNHRVKTTINGVLYSLEMVLKNAWLTNQMAFVNITAMSNDFRNNNLYCTLTNSSNASVPCNITFNSKSSLVVSFVPNVTGNYTLGIYSSTNSAITGIDTYGIRKVIVTQNQGDNSDIIDNANENTQDIIENANQNTQDISTSIQDAALNINAELINVADEIRFQTEDTILSSKCLIDYTFNPLDFNFTPGYLNSSGQVVNDSNYMVSPYLNIMPNREYKVTFGPARSGKYVCQYSGNKQLMSCWEMTGSIIFTTGNTTNTFLRVVSVKSNGEFVSVNIQGPICNDFNGMRQNEINNSLNETNDYLKDDSDPTLNNSGIESALSSVEIDDPLNYLLTLPISLLQKLNTVLSSNSCQRVSFGSLYNTELYLPCINFSEILGSNIWNTIDLFVGVGLLAVILKKFYESISNILTMGKEKEVKDKLDLPTPMEFLASILGGGKD